MRPAALSADRVSARIDRLPRKRTAVLPTGLQKLERLGERLGLEHLFVKRDDLTGVGFGGNKSRAMEFVVGDAIEAGCDVLVAGGGGEQSNHAVQCMACANSAGLDSVLVLRNRPNPRENGNALLRDILGGTVIWVDADPDFRDRGSTQEQMEDVADELRAQGRNPYVLEGSLHPLSVVAYVNAAIELDRQFESVAHRRTRVYITSEGAALGGLLLGARLLGLPWDIVGLDWRPYEEGTVQRLSEVIERAADRLGLHNPVAEADIVIRPSGGPAYGDGRPESWQAIAEVATLEGIFLDPVYTAKGMAGAFDDLLQNPVAEGEQVVFVHTGGVAALFAYETELRAAGIARRERAGAIGAGRRRS